MKKYLKYIVILALFSSCVMDHFEHPPFYVKNKSERNIRVYFATNSQVDSSLLKEHYLIIKPFDQQSPLKEDNDTLFNKRLYESDKSKNLFLFVFDNDTIQKLNRKTNWHIIANRSFIEKKIIDPSFLISNNNISHEIVYMEK